MKQFLPVYDYARVFAAVLVIYAHLSPCTPVVNSYIYCFHVPLFFIVSGMLYRGWGGWKLMVKRLLIPFFWFTFIFCVLKIIATAKSVGSIPDVFVLFVSKNFMAFVKSEQFSAVTVWFLVSLMYCWLFNRCWDKSRIVTFCLVISIISISLINGNKLPFYLSQSSFAYIFFQLGNSLKEEIVTFTSVKKNLLFILALLLISFIGFHFNGGIDIMHWNLGNLPAGINITLAIVNACSVSIALLLVCSNLPRLPFVRELAASLITIMGAQFVFIAPYSKVIGYGREWYIALPTAIGILLLCYIAHLLFQKYIPWSIGK